MKKGLIVGIIAVIVVLASGFGLYKAVKNDDNKNNTSEQSAESLENTNEQINGNIFTLTEADHPHKCIYNYTGENSKGSGTMYTDGTGRGLMETTIETEKGNSGTSNTLLNKGKVYFWFKSGDKTVGFVYNIDAFKNQSSASTNSTVQNSPRPDQKFDMDCANWSVDESVLAVPSDVEFTKFPG